MAPSEHTEVDDVETTPTTFIARRLFVYAVAALALCVVLWALIEGGERDLWTQAPAIEAFTMISPP